MRLLTLSLIELILGIGWGVVASLYAYTMISSGLESIYGLSAIAISITAVVSIFISGIIYYKGSGRFLMPLAALSLSAAITSVLHANVAVLPVLIGLASGIHGVSSLFAASNLGSDYRNYSAVYASNLLGFSLGSLLVALNLVRGIQEVITATVLICGFTYPKFVKAKFNEIYATRESSGAKYLPLFTLLRRCGWDVRP